jgi:hypothetical protein
MALDQFGRLERRLGESLTSFGQRLQPLVMRYVGLPLGDYQAHEQVVKHMLIARILATLQPNTKIQAQALFEADPTITWPIFLSRVDGFANYQSAARMVRTGTDLPRRDSRPVRDRCTIHPTTSHSNAQCMAQHPELQQAFRSAGRGYRSQQSGRGTQHPGPGSSINAITAGNPEHSTMPEMSESFQENEL